MQWQEQLPQDVTPECYANMEVIRADYEPDDTIRYCPSWSAPNKAGRPAKGKLKLSALKIAQGKKKQQKYLTRFCQICRDSVTEQSTVGYRRKIKITAPRHGRADLRKRSSRQRERWR